MNKTTLLLLTAIFVTVALLSVTSAVAVCDAPSCGSTTVVSGTIFRNADFTDTVAGANVSVSCNGATATTTSEDYGEYIVVLDSSLCNEGKTVEVNATKDGMTGSNSGTMYGAGIKELNCIINWGVVNVNLIPEFGLVAGLVTIFGAIATFFFIRRK